MTKVKAGATARKDKQNDDVQADRETVKDAAGLSDEEAKSLNDETVKEGAENVREGRDPNNSGEADPLAVLPGAGNDELLKAIKALSAKVDALEKRPAGVSISPHDPKAHQQRQVDGVVEQARGFNARLVKLEADLGSLKAEAPYVLKEAEKAQGMVHGSVDSLKSVV